MVIDWVHQLASLLNSIQQICLLSHQMKVEFLLLALIRGDTFHRLLHLAYFDEAPPHFATH